MTREQAVYFKLLLLCGYQEELMSYFDAALEKENPLSEIILQLSMTGSEPKKMLSVLNEYIFSVKQEELDYDDTVFRDVLRFLKGKYDSGVMSIQEVVDLMYRIALATERFNAQPWYTMCYMGDYYEEARIGYYDMEDFHSKFQAFINQGTTFETYPPIKLKRGVSKANKILTDSEKKFRRFDKWSKILVYSLAVLAFLIMLPLVFAKDDAVTLVSAISLIMITAATIVVSALITKKRTSYENLLSEERNAVKRTGIFKEIYEEFRHDGFEFKIHSDKFLFISEQIQNP